MFTGRKLALTLAFTVLVALAFGVSCKGFFQPNTLVSIAVQPPSPNVVLGQTTTLQAWGTYQDSTRSQITSGVAWSSSDPTTLSINQTSGVATGVSVGTATVTVAAQGLSGTASATVYIVISSLTVSPTTWSFSAANGGSTNPGFTVTANGGTDVTSSATFTSSNSTYINCVNGTDPVICSAIASTPPGRYTIVVSYTGSAITYTIQVTAS
ncbi:MAG TPA: Ig-like domain-containing protein [Terriglobales bacterium]|nr:Ig-like domain-containing protein [Terriglobales bacterium]